MAESERLQYIFLLQESDSECVNASSLIKRDNGLTTKDRDKGACVTCPNTNGGNLGTEYSTCTNKHDANVLCTVDLCFDSVARVALECDSWVIAVTGTAYWIEVKCIIHDIFIYSVC